MLFNSFAFAGFFVVVYGLYLLCARRLVVQNALLLFILTDQDLRDYVRKWGETRRDEGAEDDDDPELMRNNQYDRVVDAARKHIAQ